jgi:hypothetical protein
MLGFCLVLAAVTFIAGVGVGFLALVIVGIHAEERRRQYRMPAEPPGVIARGARSVNGLHVITRPDFQAARYKHRQPPPGQDL